MNTEAIKYLENTKIVLEREDYKFQVWQLQDKATGNIFVERKVLKEETEEKTAEKCQKDYCEWFRTGGRNVVRKYYENV